MDVLPPLEPMRARLEVLRLAESHHATHSEDSPTDDAILATAQKWSAFVVGEPVKSSKSFGQKGKDDPQ